MEFEIPIQGDDGNVAITHITESENIAKVVLYNNGQR